MIGIIVDHVVLDGEERAGIELIQMAGHAMEQFSGFKGRHVLMSHDDNKRIITVTFWDSHDDYLSWSRSDANQAIVRPPRLWASKPEPCFFDVVLE